MRIAARFGRLILALAGGAAAALAFPPFGVLPGVLGFALLVHLLDGPDVRPWRAFRIGWSAGAAYFLISTWWVAEAFLVDAQAHAWQAPFAVVFLAGGLGLLWGAAGAVYRLLAPTGAGRVLVFAAVFSLEEWLRGHILTGFPWDLPGEVWRAGSALSQGAALLGAYGMTFVTLAVAAAPALLARRPRRAEALVVAAAVAALAVLWVGGEARLTAPATSERLRLRIVQPDIPQTEKWSPEAFASILQNYLNLSAQPARERPDVIIWPEAALPLPLEELLAPGAWTRSVIENAVQPGQVLLAGAVSLGGGSGAPVYRNSLFALRGGPDGVRILARYDKHHLVPFGEYTPFDGLAALIGFKALVHLGDGFTAGPASEPIAVEGLGRLQPLICYESLFPGSFARRGPRPSWIVNVSNDAWFGDTSGPWQHLNLASYRAIEEGVPVVRATPTGVSAVIDAYGRTLAFLPMERRGVIDRRLPGFLPPTPYERWRDLPFFGLCALGLAFALRRGRRGAQRP